MLVPCINAPAADDPGENIPTSLPITVHNKLIFQEDPMLRADGTGVGSFVPANLFVQWVNGRSGTLLAPEHVVGRSNMRCAAVVGATPGARGRDID